MTTAKKLAVLTCVVAALSLGCGCWHSAGHSGIPTRRYLLVQSLWRWLLGLPGCPGRPVLGLVRV